MHVITSDFIVFIWYIDRIEYAGEYAFFVSYNCMYIFCVCVCFVLDSAMVYIKLAMCNMHYMIIVFIALIVLPIFACSALYPYCISSNNVHPKEENLWHRDTSRAPHDFDVADSANFEQPAATLMYCIASKRRGCSKFLLSATPRACGARVQRAGFVTVLQHWQPMVYPQ